MKTEEIFKREFESLCGKDATTFIGESIREKLKGIIEGNEYFYLYAEQKMQEPEWETYGDCNEDVGKSWDYEIPVYYLGGDNIETEIFEGLSHFNRKKLTGYNYFDEDKDDWVEMDYTEEQKTILEYLDEGSKDLLDYDGTGDPYKDYASRSTFMPPSWMQ